MVNKWESFILQTRVILYPSTLHVSHPVYHLARMVSPIAYPNNMGVAKEIMHVALAQCHWVINFPIETLLDFNIQM